MKSTKASSAARRPRLHHVGEQFDSDVRVAPRHHRAANEHNPHQAVTRYLFGPGQAVIEHVAREKLQENDEGERPENRKCKPVFGMMLDHHLGIFGFDQAFLVAGRLFFGHSSPA